MTASPPGLFSVFLPNDSIVLIALIIPLIFNSSNLFSTPLGAIQLLLEFLSPSCFTIFLGFVHLFAFFYFHSLSAGTAELFDFQLCFLNLYNSSTDVYPRSIMREVNDYTYSTYSCCCCLILVLLVQSH